MPLVVTKPIVGGDNGIWGPIEDTVTDTIVAYVNDQEQQRLDAESTFATTDAMNAAIAAAVSAPILGF